MASRKSTQNARVGPNSCGLGVCGCLLCVLKKKTRTFNQSFSLTTLPLGSHQLPRLPRLPRPPKRRARARVHALRPPWRRRAWLAAAEGAALLRSCAYPRQGAGQGAISRGRRACRCGRCCRPACPWACPGKRRTPKCPLARSGRADQTRGHGEHRWPAARWRLASSPGRALASVALVSNARRLLRFGQTNPGGSHLTSCFLRQWCQCPDAPERPFQTSPEAATGWRRILSSAGLAKGGSNQN